MRLAVISKKWLSKERNRVKYKTFPSDNFNSIGKNEFMGSQIT
jgi:hypothetical protein